MMEPDKAYKKIVAIHQPNFFPWLGFFHKIAHCDEFIVLDHVTNNPRQGIWTRRVKLIIHETERWWSVPLVKPKGQHVQPINEMRVNTSDPALLEKQRESLHRSYKKAPFYEEVAAIVDAFFAVEEPLIALRNTRCITTLCQRLGIDTPFVLSSDMSYTVTAAELMLELTYLRNGDCYYCGGGADGYMDQALFVEKKVGLVYQNFKHPVYSQFNSKEFVPGLSILDAIANCGFEEVGRILREQSQPEKTG
jgi:hypothetical protein